MILVKINNISTAKPLLSGAAALAVQLGKEFGVMAVSIPGEEIRQTLEMLEVEESRYFSVSPEIVLAEFCEEKDVSFLFIQHDTTKKSPVLKTLKECRDLRIPYVLYSDHFGELDMHKVLLPVGFLEEEIEKAQFASAFGRFCGSEIKMLLANDYGSKAAATATRMQELFDKFDFSYTLEKAEKDSFKVELEAVEKAPAENAGLVIVSASREYGLDDLLFGPKEFHVLKKSTVPVLLVNPRGDLYALCD